MNNFYIVTNPIKDADLVITRRVEDFLKKNNCNLVKDPSQPIDVLISIGGDGTLIRAVREMEEVDAAIIGINKGTLGFLTEIENDSIEESLQRIIDGNYFIEERMMLQATSDEMNVTALNDIVVSGTTDLKVVDLQVYVNGSFLASYRADGIVISTPTGSTGYNLSAGGPVVEPGSRVMVITPISAHSLNGRSLILSPDDEVTIRLDGMNEGAVFYDGEKGRVLGFGDSVTVTSSKKATKFIKLSRESFVTALSRKLGK